MLCSVYYIYDMMPRRVASRYLYNECMDNKHAHIITTATKVCIATYRLHRRLICSKIGKSRILFIHNEQN